MDALRRAEASVGHRIDVVESYRSCREQAAACEAICGNRSTSASWRPLNNLAKYAEATKPGVAFSTGNGALSFTVTDDGVGFDPSIVTFGTGLQGMADRLDALGAS